MAIVFMLAVNFGDDESAAADAERAVVSFGPVPVREFQSPLTGPWTHRTGHADPADRYIEFSVGVRDVSMGGSFSPRVNARELSGAEVSAVGRRLYELLKHLRGYRAAMVGWDPEGCVDLSDYRPEIANDGLEGLDGLVVSNEVARELRIQAGLTSFVPGYLWIPYQGSNALP